jgi:hypothetical protein
VRLTKVNRCLAEGRARLRQLGAMAQREPSKDAFEDEHPPAGHQMIQVVRQALDP